MPGQKPYYCRACDRETMHDIQWPNAVLHVLLVVVTFGLWLAGVIVLVLRRLPRCQVCQKANWRFLRSGKPNPRRKSAGEDSAKDF